MSHFLVGEIFCFVMNQLFILRIIACVNGESNIKYYTECIVLTFVAPHPLGNKLPGNFPSLLFGNLSDHVAI